MTLKKGVRYKSKTTFLTRNPFFDNGAWIDYLADLDQTKLGYCEGNDTLKILSFGLVQIAFKVAV